MKRRSMIVLLAGLNLMLLAALFYSAFPMPAAYAQRVGTSGNYMLIAAQMQSGYDAVYLFDVAERRMHAFTVEKGGSDRLDYRDSRDLQQDFRE